MQPCASCPQQRDSHAYAEVEGLKRKLTRDLSPDTPEQTKHDMLHISWDIGDCLSTWYRPGVDTVFYPYVPPHVSKAREVRKTYVVALPDRAAFAVSLLGGAVACLGERGNVLGRGVNVSTYSTRCDVMSHNACEATELCNRHQPAYVQQQH